MSLRHRISPGTGRKGRQSIVNRRIQGQSLDGKPRGLERFFLRVFVITLIPLTVAGGIFLFLSVYLFLKGAPFLRLEEVRIEGNRRVSRDEILAITGLEGGPNILALDIKGMNRRLGEHPWIERCTIRRELPGTIRIAVREREPIALIHLGRLYYIDANGVVFDEARGRDKAAYPILTGVRREDLEKGEAKTRRLVQAAIHLLEISRRSPVLPYRSISQIHLDRAVGLLVYTMERGIEVRMGFGDFERKLSRLSRVWPTVRSMELCAVECSIPGKIIVQSKRVEAMRGSKKRSRQRDSK